MNGCESNEVLLRTLPVGAFFECVLSHTTGIRGRIVEHTLGSTIVDVGKYEHWCYDAPVVPHPEIKDAQGWIKSNEKENIAMSKNGTKKARRRVIRFAIGKKDPLEKYLDAKNTAYSALMYRAIKEAKEPVTFAEIFDEIKRSVSNKTEGKTPKNTLSVILAKMVKEGYIARSEAKEANAEAVAA